MSSNLPLVPRSHRGRAEHKLEHKLEINIPQQQIHENGKGGGGGLINKGGVMSSEYGTSLTKSKPA